jgi:hypothetical protein
VWCCLLYATRDAAAECRSSRRGRHRSRAPCRSRRSGVLAEAHCEPQPKWRCAVEAAQSQRQCSPAAVAQSRWRNAVVLLGSQAQSQKRSRRSAGAEAQAQKRRRTRSAGVRLSKRAVVEVQSEWRRGRHSGVLAGAQAQQHCSRRACRRSTCRKSKGVRAQRRKSAVVAAKQEVA